MYRLDMGAGMNFAENILIFGVSVIGILLLGFICGRFFSAWFPFRLSKKLYLPVRNARLQRLLISGEAFHWGRTQPKQLPEKYYRVSPENRGKMCVWGILFYLDWYSLSIFCILAWYGRLPEGLRPLLPVLFLALPLLSLLESLDFLIGAHRAMKQENLQYTRINGILAAIFCLILLIAFQLARLFLA